MKILIVSPYLPHPQCGHGTGVFVYGLLQQISRRHAVTLISFCDKQELILPNDLRTLPIKLYKVPRGKGAQSNLLWNVYLVSIRLFQLVRSIVFWQPYYVSKFRHTRMARLIERVTQEEPYDIVQFEFLQMAQCMKCIRSGKSVLHEYDVAFRPAYRRYKKATSLLIKAVMFIEWCRWFVGYAL
jgi:hypothetical protein